MDLDHLRTFLVVAERGSISRAAERLPLTQSAVSRQIQALERALGAPLFSRDGRRLRLTDAGRLLTANGPRILRAIAEAQEAIDAVQDVRRGHLRIGAASTIGTYLLPPALGAFKQAHPGVDITLQIANKAQTLDRLLGGDIDLGFVGPPIDDRELARQKYVADDLVLVTAPGHRLAGRRSVRARELADEVFIMRERGSGTREIMEEELLRAGIAIKKTMELGSTEAIKQAVAVNLGVSIISRHAVALEVRTRRLCAIPVRDLRLGRQLYAVHHRRRPLPKVAETFLGFLREAAGARVSAPGAATAARARPSRR